ncbi:hypothetical protein BH23VER1_BH23VER1_00040 [soil metagenome]
MKNPYHDIVEPEEIRVPRGWAYGLIALFLAICVVPPAWRNLSATTDESGWVPVVELWKNQSDETAELEGGGISAHLKAFETRLEEAPFAEAARRRIQLALTESIGEGNTKVHIGADGWLFFLPAIEAITGSGPVRPPELGAASDPTLKRWQPPLPVIKRYAGELRERGVDLLLVPVPVKPMIYPEKLAASTFPTSLTHADTETLYEELRAAGVDVLDLAPLFWDLKVQGEVFLKQDTHWRPEAMRAAAEAVAARVRAAPWFAEAASDRGRFSAGPVGRRHIGDLVQKLDLPAGSTAFSEEVATLQRVTDSATGGRPGSDRASPVVLLGDSFVNIFDMGDLGFGTGAKDELIGAGFAQHLAAELGMPLDVNAKNGKAATQVRKELAERPDDEIRAKRLVVWVIASRDLLYSAKLGNANAVHWGDVAWNPDRSDAAEDPATGDGLAISDEGTLVEATLAEAATVPDPSSLNYASGTYETRWTDVAAADGPGRADELYVRLWAFREKKAVPSATVATGGTLVPGKRYRFLAVPLFMNEAANSAQVQEMEKGGFPEIYFVEMPAPVP